MNRRNCFRAGVFVFALGLLLAGLALVPRAARAAETANGIPVVTITLTCENGETPEEAFAAINESPDHSVKRAATLSIAVPDGYTGDYSDEPLSDQGPLKVEYIRGRGNTTWNAAKKPYKIKLKSSTDLMGMGKNKHWLLISNPYDPSLIRNRLVSYMGEALGLDYTPQMLPVDLVVDGTYMGSYYLCEQVRVGNSRVDIDELDADDNELPELSGGYLFSLSPYQEEPAGNVITTSGNVTFCGESPVFASDDPDDDLGTEAQYAYLASYLQAIEDAIYSGGDWQALMDAESTAAYWWVQEFTLNSDAFITPSTYLYKPREGKVFWGPLWDFDSSMTTYQNEGEPEDADVSGFNSSRVAWVEYLRTYDASFAATLREVWARYDAVIEEIVREGGVLDQYKAELAASWQADSELWREENAHHWDEKYLNMSYDEMIEELRTWFQRRRAWVNENIDAELTHALCRLDFEVDGERVATEYVRVGTDLLAEVAWPYKEGKVFMGWKLPDGSYLDEYATFSEDTVLVATYADASDVVAGEDVFFLRDECWDSLGHVSSELECVIVPYDADEKQAFWSSSNPEVASVSPSGKVTYLGVGETTITATLANGASASYVLHVVASDEGIANDVGSMVAEEDALRMRTGDYAQVKLAFGPEKLYPNAVYLSCEVSDEAVAEIDACGVVHALGAGTATITIRCGWEDEPAPVVVTVVVADSGDEPAHTPGWEKIDGAWYYFDEAGQPLCDGWLRWDGAWYHFAADGACETDAWVRYDGSWCYVGANGKAVTDTWVRYDGSWCYIGANGRAVWSTWVRYEGHWCYIGSNGRAVWNAWAEYEGREYYIGWNGFATGESREIA